MPTNTNLQPKAIIGIAVFIVAGLLFFGLRSGGSGARDVTKELIRSPDAYRESAQKAQQLSEDALRRFSEDKPLTSDDKDKLIHAGVLFESIIDYNPRVEGPCVGAGLVYRALGANDKSEKYFLQAIANGADSPDRDSQLSVAEAHYNLSLIYFDIHNYKASLKEASEAIRIVPKSANYLSARAQDYVQLNDKDKAIQDLKWALELDPKNKRANGLHKLLVTALFR